MITIRRSDTGSYVLTHEPSQMVMVGEDLQATHARLEEHLREHPALASTPALAPPATSSRKAWFAGLAMLALLPFLWLSVLHYTLGRLVDELRTPAAATQARPTKEVEALTLELHELQQRLDRLQVAVGNARRNPEKLPGRRLVPPRRPKDQGLEAPEDEAPEDEAPEDEAPEDEP